MSFWSRYYVTIIYIPKIISDFLGELADK